jgi:glucose/arabinose dehydrogenase
MRARGIFLLLVLFCAACSSRVTPIPSPTNTPAIPLAVPATATETSLPPATPTPEPPTAEPTAAESPTAGPLPTTPIPLTGPALAVSAELRGITAAWYLAASGLDNPVGLVSANDGSGRLFIVEKPGRIRVVQGGALLPEPFLDISNRVGSSGSEQGLLGLAFHPHYKDNDLFFVNFTNNAGNTVIARFQAADPAANTADPGSETDLLHVQQPFPNHNGGEVAFGPDGLLYLGLGDGGSGGDPQGNGQSTNTLLGKILRIDVDHGDLYAIPPDNPFAQGGGKGEIYAYGLRNPWRFSFDRATGDLWIADVGQNSWEEIDYLPAGSPPGANFGWNYREGLHAYQGNPPARLKLVDPVAEYGHDQGCSVTGGYVYRGAALPAWKGVYLFGDYCSGIVWGLSPRDNGGWQMTKLFDTGVNISSFGEDEAGVLYLVALSGEIYRLDASQ